MHRGELPKDVDPGRAAIGRSLTNRWSFLAIVVLATVAATVLVWLAAARAGREHAGRDLRDELNVLSQSVESEIERFRYLPAVIGREGRIRAALASPTPQNMEAANRYLKQVRSDSGADELYVMTRDGLTIAASNYDEASSFIGNNYRFRPYFKRAMSTGQGRYYAVGVTTGKPGYFLASAIREKGRLLGVAVVKVDMLDIEQAWRRSSTIAALTDSNGIVFLASDAGWRYRPLHPLNDAVLEEVAKARKYDGVDLTSATPLFPHGSGLPAEARLPGMEGRFLIGSLRIEPDGWRLIGVRSLAPIHAESNLFGMLTILVGLLVCATGTYIGQRRQIVRTKLDEHDRLEARVAERTFELNREVEERRRAEADLRDAQATLIQTAKLAALGRMSAAIVHEVSQPLSALENTLATAGLLAERGDAAQVSKKMRSAREMIRRMQRTVKLLRSFARKESGPRKPVSVRRSIEAAVELAQHRIDEQHVAVGISCPGDLAVLANPIRLEQVVLNLLLNALDAVSVTPAPAVRITACATGDRVAIDVGDNGTGIPTVLHERIAEPFFTTKKTGEGLGLGLSISRTIVGEFGGSLTFSSDEGGGSTFTISLPAAPARQEAAE